MSKHSRSVGTSASDVCCCSIFAAVSLTREAPAYWPGQSPATSASHRLCSRVTPPGQRDTELSRVVQQACNNRLSQSQALRGPRASMLAGCRSRRYASDPNIMGLKLKVYVPFRILGLFRGQGAAIAVGVCLPAVTEDKGMRCLTC